MLTVATSFLLLSLKWAVPTRYTILPSGVVRRVTVSGRSGSACRRWVRTCHNTSTASESAKKTHKKNHNHKRWNKNTTKI